MDIPVWVALLSGLGVGTALATLIGYVWSSLTFPDLSVNAVSGVTADRRQKTRRLRGSFKIKLAHTGERPLSVDDAELEHLRIWPRFLVPGLWIGFPTGFLMRAWFGPTGWMSKGFDIELFEEKKRLDFPFILKSGTESKRLHFPFIVKSGTERILEIRYTLNYYLLGRRYNMPARLVPGQSSGGLFGLLSELIGNLFWQSREGYFWLNGDGVLRLKVKRRWVRYVVTLPDGLIAIPVSSAKESADNQNEAAPVGR